MRGVGRAVAGIACGVAAVGASVPSATAIGWSDPFAVSGVGSASSPQLVAGPGGRTTVFRNSFGTGSIWMRTIRSDGSLGAERQVTPSLEDGPYGWRAVGWDGGSVLVWPTAENALLGRRVDRRGRLGPVREIFPRAFGYPELSIGIDARGNATIAMAKVTTESLEPKGWRTTSATISVRRWSASGRLGRPVVVPAPAGDLSRFPQVAAAPTGQTALAWWRGRDESPGYALQTATVERDGAIVDVREIATAARRRLDLDSDGSPKLAVADDGDVTVAWTAGDNRDLLVRHLAAGSRLGAVERLDLGVESFAQPVVDRSGRVTIVWASAPGSRAPSPVTVRARRLDSVGALGRSWVLSDSERRSSHPVATVDRSGSVTAVWGELRREAYPQWESIQARRISARGALEPERTVGASAPRVQIWDLALAIDGHGTATVAWPRWSGGRVPNTRILASRLVASCPPSRLRGAVPRTGRRYTGHVKGLRLRVRSKRAVDLAVRAGSVSYRVPGGAGERVARLPRGAFATRGRDVRLVLPKRLRADLPAGRRVTVRLRVGARPYASGCPYQPPRVVDVAARVGWVKP